MSEPQGTQRVGSDDSEMREVDPEGRSAAAVTEPAQETSTTAGDDSEAGPEVQVTFAVTESDADREQEFHSSSSRSHPSQPVQVRRNRSYQSQRVQRDVVQLRLAAQSNPPTEMPTVTAEHENIGIEIGRILDNVKVGHSVMILDPDDCYNIYILGVDVWKAKLEFRTLISQDRFKLFNIKEHSLKAIHSGLPQYIKHFMPFNLEIKVKANEEEGETEYSMDRGKCQLILPSNPEEDIYYGVSVAHAFLSDEQMKILMDSDSIAQDIQDEIKSRSANVELELMPHCREEDERIPVIESPLIRYRHYFQDERKILEDFAIFQISVPKMRKERFQLPDPDVGVEKLKVFTSGFNQRKYIVEGIIPISTREETNLLKDKRVLIAFAEGKVTLPPCEIPRSSSVGSNMKLGMMLTFVTTSPYSLEAGHSGYMVYLVDRDDRRVYIAGMLTGKINCPQNVTGKVFYTAALVGAGLGLFPDLNLSPQRQTVQSLRDRLQDA